LHSSAFFTLQSALLVLYCLYNVTANEGNMFAVVDFDRQKSFFFTCFQTASDFITQYPVIQNTVVVDLSEQQVAAEML
jgi:hypothetical protein